MNTASDPPAPERQEQQEPEGQRRMLREPKRILVVENDIQVADEVVAVLDNAGYRVEVATDAKYGLMLAESFLPHVIVLSTTLEGMRNSDMTQILRNAPKFASLMRYARLLYLTDRTKMISKRFHQLPGAEMSDHIFKPITPVELLEKVGRALAEMDEKPESH